MSETELKETLSEEALERLNDRYGFWRKGKCDRDVMCALNELVSHRQRLAATEQREERLVVAVRTALDRLAKRILAEIVYCAPENRALAEEVARVAKIETDLIVARAALTAPATQPTERAAAERALIDDFGEDGSLTWVHPWYVLPDYDSGNGLEIAFCHPKDDSRGRMLTAFVPLSALRCFTTDAAKEGTTEETTFERGYRWLVEATDGAAKEET